MKLAHFRKRLAHWYVATDASDESKLLGVQHKWPQPSIMRYKRPAAEAGESPAG
jgi:hypothetical protein